MRINLKLHNVYDKSQVKSSHYYLYAFNNANCVKAALHQLDIKLGGFTSALQYLDGEIMCRNGVILLWPDEISSLNLGCSRVRLYVSMCNYRLYHCLCYYKKKTFPRTSAASDSPCLLAACPWCGSPWRCLRKTSPIVCAYV